MWNDINQLLEDIQTKHINYFVLVKQEIVRSCIYWWSLDRYWGTVMGNKRVKLKTKMKDQKHLYFFLFILTKMTHK